MTANRPPATTKPTGSPNHQEVALMAPNSLPEVEAAGEGTIRVESRTRPGLFHWVSADGRNCSCEAGLHGSPRCWRRDKVRAERALQVVETEPGYAPEPTEPEALPFRVEHHRHWTSMEGTRHRDACLVVEGSGRWATETSPFGGMNFWTEDEAGRVVARFADRSEAFAYAREREMAAHGASERGAA
jgi:hypothetical protein